MFSGVDPNVWCVLGVACIIGGALAGIGAVKMGSKVVAILVIPVVVAGVVLLASNAQRADDLNMSKYITQCQREGHVIVMVDNVPRCGPLYAPTP